MPAFQRFLHSASFGLLWVAVCIPLPAAILTAREMVRNASEASLFRESAAYFSLCVLLFLFLMLAAIAFAIMAAAGQATQSPQPNEAVVPLQSDVH